MDFKKFNAVAELVGIVAIVASLIFVGMQLRQSQRIALAEVEGLTAMASIEMASLLSTNEDIWHRGISEEEMTAAERNTFDGIVYALGDRAWALYTQYELLDNDEAAASVVHEFAAYLHARPGAKRAWIEREEELRRTRATLEPERLEVYSFFIETMMTDFTTLDRLAD